MLVGWDALGTGTMGVQKSVVASNWTNGWASFSVNLHLSRLYSSLQAIPVSPELRFLRTLTVVSEC